MWPYIASQVGLALLWGAAIGILTQWFINMEIERYTLATGETAVIGFTRLWRHRGLVFALTGLFRESVARLGDVVSHMLTYLVGGNAALIAIGCWSSSARR